jgi:hypothetical protein
MYWGRTRPGHIDIHQDVRHSIDALGRHFGIFPSSVVIDVAGQFDDPVMYFDTNCSGSDILLTIKLSNDLLLYLHIVFHQAVPRLNY